MTVALAPVTVDRPYTLLLVAAEQPAVHAGSSLYFAWRWYGDLEGTPTEIFAQFVEQFGIALEDGGKPVMFMGQRDISGVQVYGDAMPREAMVSAMVQGNSDGRVRTSWAFAIDTSRYDAEVRLRRG